MCVPHPAALAHLAATADPYSTGFSRCVECALHLSGGAAESVGDFRHGQAFVPAYLDVLDQTVPRIGRIGDQSRLLLRDPGAPLPAADAAASMPKEA